MADPSADLPPVLLLHGFGTSASRTWRDNGWVDVLADIGRTVIAPDLLGHGTAPKPHDPQAYAELGPRVLDALPDGPVDGIGFSLGARTLLQLAGEEPSRFRRLVVAGVGANLLREDDSGLVQRALRGEADPADPVARYFAGLAADPGADPLALAALLEHRLPPLGSVLGAISCPTLVVLGDRDFAGPPDPLIEALPHAQLVVLPRTDHFATPKDVRFMDAALDFLSAS